jgi:hypothetical protein
MTEATLLPFDLPAVRRKKLTVDFDGGSQSSDGGLLLLREAERSVGICARLAGSLTDRRDPSRIEHSLVELIKTRVLAICCGYEDGTALGAADGQLQERVVTSCCRLRCSPCCGNGGRHGRPGTMQQACRRRSAGCSPDAGRGCI